MKDTIEIQVQVEEVNKNKNQIIFKPYSPEFKNSIENYPSMAIDITALDLTKNVKDQLLRISTNFIKQTLLIEKNDNLLFQIENIDLQAGENIEKEITASQLFEPESINTTVPSTSSTLTSAYSINFSDIESSGDKIITGNLESTDIFSVI